MAFKANHVCPAESRKVDYLKFEQEFAVLRILNATLFFQQTLLVLITLQFLYVFYGGLEDGALVLPNVPDDIVIPSTEK